MKVALVGPGILPIPPNGYGAVEKHIANLAEYMSKRGHEVTILNKLLGEYSWGIRVGQLLRNADYDVVHAHTSFIGGYLSSFADVNNMVYTSHSPLWFIQKQGPKEMWGMMWERHAIAGARVVIALTGTHGKLIADQTEGRVHVVPNGVNTDLFKPQWSQRKGDRVCMLGKVVPRKRVHVVAQAARDAGAEFHVIGSQPDQEYAEQVEKVNPETIFHRDIPEGEVADLLGRMDVFVHASEAEAMSMAVLEAMASGLPVIHSPACADVVQETGVLVTTDRPGVYADTIKFLLGNAKLREELGAQARSLALQEYSWDGVAERVERVYNVVVPTRTST